MAAWPFVSRGIDDVVLVDPNPHRRRAVEALGFWSVDLDGVESSVLKVLGESPRAVVEASGHVTSPGLAVELAGPVAASCSRADLVRPSWSPSSSSSPRS